MLANPKPQPNTTKINSTELDKVLRDLSDIYLVELKNYPAISLEQLNSHLTNNPLQHTLLGVINSFELDDGYLLPIKMVAPEHECVVAEIVAVVRNWSKNTCHGGRVTSSQGAFILSQNPRLYLIPDVAYIDPEVWQSLTEEQAKTYRGEPFSPTIVVEIDKLEGPGSRRREQMRKAKLYLHTGTVQIVWLIDPINKIMLECTKGASEGELVNLSEETAWRDLSGGDTLPGFVLTCSLLDAAMSKAPPPVEEKKIRVCPDCGEELYCTKGFFKIHFDTH